MSTSQLVLIEEEISGINSLLNSVPFSPVVDEDNQEFFLGIYRLSYDQLIELNNLTFPIDSNKLLKLGISLGNLLKTLQSDEEQEQQAQLYQQQQQQREQEQQQQQQQQQEQQHSFQEVDESYEFDGSTTPTRNSFMGSIRKVSKQLPPTPTSNSQSSPFLSDVPPTPPPKPHIISSPVLENGAFSSRNGSITNTTTGQYPMYQIKFIKNLLNILKNFDVGNINNNNENLTSPTTPTTLQRLGSKNSSSSSLSTQTTLPSIKPGSNVSPIKLNSRQLLIEKLEININLDTLFTYKIIFKLLLQILNIIHANIVKVRPASTPLLGKESSSSLSHSFNNSHDETSSIFSSNSETARIPSQNGHTTHYSGVGDYISVLNQCLLRISNGITNPFKRFIFMELVENNVQQDFNQVLSILA
ncbi:hypothetical protein DFJ63DRAFT_248365 [Scheffersomyces coipomensis]|uniref:uncharacterized protein n=1 Tax=Scheffersomyces coipomensis TaxID=1788519 RepID=UPI00315DBC10